MIDWSRGYSAQWRIFRVNRRTWADGERLHGVDSMSVQRSLIGTSPLLESGTMKVTGEEPQADYYRMVMTAKQGGQIERVDVATMLCERTGGRMEHGADTATMECRSVLWPATRHLQAGSYAPAGADGAAYVARLLTSVIHAPVVTHGSFALAQHVVHELGATYLDAAWEVLRAGGFTMQVHGDGRVHVLPQPTDPTLTLDAAGAALVLPGIDYTLDVGDVPNVYMAVSGTDMATATNDDPTSPTSTTARGYVVDVLDTRPIRVDGETLQAYVLRRLREESVVTSERTYSRRWWPDVYPGSVVRGSMASVRLDGDMRITTQQLTCGAGIAVKERAEMEVSTWS